MMRYRSTCRSESGTVWGYGNHYLGSADISDTDFDMREKAGIKGVFVSFPRRKQENDGGLGNRGGFTT